MVLGAPEPSRPMADLDGLDAEDPVAGEHPGPGRRHQHRIRMDRRGIPGRRATGEQGMAPALFGGGDRPGEAVFRAARILRRLAPRHHGGDLHPPAGPEDRQARLKGGPHEVDLAGHLGAPLGHLQGRPREDHPVEPVEPWGRRIRVGRCDETAGGAWGKVLHHGGVGLGRATPGGGHMPFAGRAIVSIGDEEAQHECPEAGGWDAERNGLWQRRWARSITAAEPREGSTGMRARPADVRVASGSGKDRTRGLHRREPGRRAAGRYRDQPVGPLHRVLAAILKEIIGPPLPERPHGESASRHPRRTWAMPTALSIISYCIQADYCAAKLPCCGFR